MSEDFFSASNLVENQGTEENQNKVVKQIETMIDQ